MGPRIYRKGQTRETGKKDGPFLKRKGAQDFARTNRCSWKETEREFLWDPELILKGRHGEQGKDHWAVRPG